jgi:hypothetical protein
MILLLTGCINPSGMSYTTLINPEERKKQYDEWMGKIDQLVVPMGKNEKIKDAIKPVRDFVELVYGDKMR